MGLLRPAPPAPNRCESEPPPKAREQASRFGAAPATQTASRPAQSPTSPTSPTGPTGPTGPTEPRSPGPPVLRPHLDHLAEDLVPGLLLLEGRIRKHAAVPADVFDSPRPRVLQPVARASRDIEFPVRIIGRTMPARFIM